MKDSELKVGSLVWTRVQDSKEHRRFGYGPTKPSTLTPVVVVEVLTSDDGRFGYRVARRDGGRPFGRIRTARALHAEDRVLQ
jgi:hypothetical protein